MRSENSTASVKSDFLAIMGMPQLPISATSTVAWGVTKLQVALVLDNTGSMADNNKMTALKTATHQLLTQLKGAATNTGDVQVAIVPFAREVNIGASPTNMLANWIDWSNCQKYLATGLAAVTGGADAQTSGVTYTTWNGCISDRTQSYDASGRGRNLPTSLFPAGRSPCCPMAIITASGRP